jgi:hypothetical protein
MSDVVYYYQITNYSTGNFIFKLKKINCFCSDVICRIYMDLTRLQIRVWLLTYLLTYLSTAWSRVLLKKLTSFEDSKETPRIFMKPRVSLPYSQVPATCPYPEPTLTCLVVTHKSFCCRTWNFIARSIQFRAQLIKIIKLRTYTLNQISLHEHVF